MDIFVFTIQGLVIGKETLHSVYSKGQFQQNLECVFSIDIFLLESADQQTSTMGFAHQHFNRTYNCMQSKMPAMSFWSQVLQQTNGQS